MGKMLHIELLYLPPYSPDMNPILLRGRGGMGHLP